MSNTASVVAGAPGALSAALRELVRRQPSLAILGLALLATSILTAGAAVVDPQTFDDVNKWLKPARFQASLGLFSLTMAWCVGYLKPSPQTARTLRWIVPAVLTTTLYEAIYITVQAALGQASHWNTSDPLHSVLWGLMGIGAALLTYTAFALALELRRNANPALPAAFRLAVILGLALTFILGTATGGLMALSGHHYVQHFHSVPGLPIVGWSTVDGDWRPSHFFGMHAAQILPVFGALVTRLETPRGTAAVAIFAAAYTVLTVYTLVQAALNHPFLAF